MSEFTFHVKKQPSERYSIVLRHDGNEVTDRVVVDNIATPLEANRLVDELAKTNLYPTDIRRIHDYGARQFRDDKEYQVIYE